MNYLEKYLDYASRSTDAPAIFHRHLAVSLAGAALGNRVWIQFGARRMTANTYTLLLGAPGITRKTTALALSEGIASRLGDLIPFYSIDTSYEAFLQEVSENSSGLMVVPEWTHWTASKGREYAAGIDAALCNLYDGRPHQRRLVNQPPVLINNAAITVWAAATPESYLHRRDESDVTSGAASRWCVVKGEPPCAPDFSWPKSLRPEGQAELVAMLHETQRLQGEVKPSPDAVATFEKYAEELSPLNLPPRVRAFAPRHTATLLKYALALEAVNHLSLRLSAASVTAAMDLVRELRQCLIDLNDDDFAFSRKEAEIKKVRRAIKSAGVIEYRQLLRNMRVSKRVLEPIVATLRDTGEIVDRKEGSPGPGRKKRVLQWADGLAEVLENDG